MQIEVKIRGLMVDPSNGTPVVILKDLHSEMMLPIWVGTYEANAIALEIEKTAAQRPLTHDLMRNFLIASGSHVTRVVISELRDSTFFAVIQITSQAGEASFLDARPSDAIALAMRFDCPIMVEEEVMRTARVNEAKMDDEDDDAALPDADDEDWPDVIGDGGDLTM